MSYYIDKEVDKVTIRLKDIEKLPFNNPEGSYNLLAPRLFNQTYAEYLQMIIRYFGATVRGKNSTYMTIFFKKDREGRAEILCKELNKRLNKVLKEYNNGEY